MTPDFQEWVMARVAVRESGCWEWIGGGTHASGYFRTTRTTKSTPRDTDYSHRFSYRAFKGEIPSGLHVCHTCDNRKCANPNHLFLGTRKDNMQDAVRKGRMAKGPRPYLSGELSPHAKLTAPIVRSIRALSKFGFRDCSLARRFGVTPENIRAIKNFQTWKEI